MIEKYNFHWREGFFYNFPKTRELFDKLIKEIDSKQVLSIIGLRRVGKTTLLKQLIDYLIKNKNVKRDNILFYSFDEEVINLQEVIHEYELRIGKNINEIKEKVYIFFDEIQKLENWQNQIKYYYDSYSNLKFLISGSSSLFIKKQARESLAGRIYEFVLKPLNFREFLVFRNKEELIKKPKLFRESLKNEFKQFQKRQFVEIVNEKEERIAQYTSTIIEKIIFQDIPRIFPVEYEDLLLRIIKIVASNPGLFSDYGELAKELGINRVTISNYFFYLEESFLLKKLYNFSKNRLTSEKKMKRFYLNSTSFFPYLNERVEEAKLIENLVVASLEARFFWRTPQGYEVDLILEQDNKPIPLEIKYKDNISKKDTKSLLKFCEKFRVNRAIMVTSEREGEIKSGKNIIKLIPAWRLFLELV